jgi:cytochrome c
MKSQSFKRYALPKAIPMVLSLLFLLGACTSKRKGQPRVLVFSKTGAFVHSSIDAGIAAIQRAGQEDGFIVDTTTNPAYFHPDSLDKYAAVVFNNTSGDVLNHHQENAFERYIQAGGGYLGIHAASDTEYDWGWYGRLVGGYFKNHPQPQPAKFIVKNKTHPATLHLPDTFTYDDEWYNFTKLYDGIKVLVEIDETSYKGGQNGDFHPMVWYHDYDGGRAFYYGFGHNPTSFEDSLQFGILKGGLKYVIDENLNLNYRKAVSLEIPEKERFVKTQLLLGDLYEPTEMAILPNLDILIAQRRGELMLFEQETKSLSQVGMLDVYHQSGVPNVNAEEGFLGLTIDPDFAKNNFVYAFYSPADTSVNRLSRFIFKDKKLDLSSEKVILEFYSQRQICCHTGGSLAFGPDRMLFISTGDNSTPFDQPTPFKNEGFSPTDGRPGFEQYDARRSSANTNDLRGKVLRIQLSVDGTYKIPEGNLFPSTESKARPEIFAMGTRNAYRISVDQTQGTVYWGDVGPDANNDRWGTRGSKGYDEINQAKTAGFYGWPLFIGANYPYRQFNYETGEVGEFYNAEKPQNLSPNNTGLVDLPPARPAFIWYPYDASPHFPQVGAGGRNAMAGPVYYQQFYDKKTRYPDYYQGKLFIYDWIRGWVKAVTLTPDQDFDKLEPFLEDQKFNSPIDMEVGPDGRIYVLEYGSGWFSKNANAGIARIDYIEGNLPPKVGAITLEQVEGDLPFALKAHVEAKDFENDPMTYTWTIGTEQVVTQEPSLTYTLNQVGEVPVTVSVEDSHKNKSESATVMAYAGNARPEIEIVFADGIQSVKEGQSLQYEVIVKDKSRAFEPANLVVAVDYVQGKDQAGANLGHQRVSSLVMGRTLMISNNCESCHQVDVASVGPSFKQVALKYKGQPDARGYLANKIKNGGSGVWGEVAMAANPTLKDGELQQIVSWIQSLAADAPTTQTLPAKGTIKVALPADKKEAHTLRMTVHYTNNPGLGIKPLASTQTKDVRIEK